MSLRGLALVLFALLAASAQAEAAAGKVSKEALESQGRKRTYYLYAPPALKPSAPLVLLFHGSNRNGLTLVEKWKELAEREGFVIAGPDASEPRGWRMPEDGPDFVRDLVESLVKKHSVNPRRVYLFGHSSGAVFSLHLSMMESEYFAAAAVHAGSWRSEEEFALLSFARRKIPLAIIVGDRDAFFPLGSVRATEAALKARDFPVEVKVVKGHDHWYYDRAAEFNRDAWAFLQKHELGVDPKYQVYASAGGRGGRAGGDDFNAAVKEINALRAKAGETLERFYAKEAELRSKDRFKEAAAVAALAREQLGLLDASAATYRESALKAGRAGERNFSETASQYFSLVAQAAVKRAEALAAMRERAQALAGEEPSDGRTRKMNAALVLSEKLHREADELEQKAGRVRAGQGP